MKCDRKINDLECYAQKILFPSQKISFGCNQVKRPIEEDERWKQNTDQAVLQRSNKNISEGRLFHGRAINYRKDGSEFLMEWKIVLIRNEKDEITPYLVNQKDVSDQQR